MRLRNMKDKEKKLQESKYVILNAREYKGKWRELFNNDNPIHIEIGMGKGKFIKENAENNPNINYIGIERLNNVLARAVEMLEEVNLDNLRVINLNAIYLEEVFDKKEVEKIFLNFSDPWPKKRHSKRRLTNKIYLDIYDKILSDEGIIEFKTDNQELFEYSLETINNYGLKFEKVFLDLHKTFEDEIIKTEYEEKFIKLGLRIYKLIASKK